MQVRRSISQIAVATMVAATIAVPMASAMPADGGRVRLVRLRGRAAGHARVHGAQAREQRRRPARRGLDRRIAAGEGTTGTADHRTEAAKGPSIVAAPAGPPTWPVDPKPIDARPGGRGHRDGRRRRRHRLADHAADRGSARSRSPARWCSWFTRCAARRPDRRAEHARGAARAVRAAPRRRPARLRCSREAPPRHTRTDNALDNIQFVSWVRSRPSGRTQWTVWSGMDAWSTRPIRLRA